VNQEKESRAEMNPTMYPTMKMVFDLVGWLTPVREYDECCQKRSKLQCHEQGEKARDALAAIAIAAGLQRWVEGKRYAAIAATLAAKIDLALSKQVYSPLGEQWETLYAGIFQLYFELVNQADAGSSNSPESPENEKTTKMNIGSKRTGRRGRKRNELSPNEQRAVDLWRVKDQMELRDYADLIAALKEEGITFTRPQITKLLDRVRKANK
jgi:hypothetical protein